MKVQSLSGALTVLNLLILSSLVLRSSFASSTEVVPMLRGRALEIVDERGVVRAEIKIHPAEPELKMPDGTKGYPESVLLRLIDSEKGPNVKLSATEDGAGLVLGGDAGYLQALSRGKDNPFIKLVPKVGRDQTIRPE